MEGGASVFPSRYQESILDQSLHDHNELIVKPK